VVNPIILNNQTHRNLRVSRLRAAGDYAAANVVSVVPREFARLLAHYPIVFTKSAESGRFEPGVLLGFERGENLFLSGGRWDAVYVPLQIQRQPFSLLSGHADPAAGKPARLDVALDLASPYVQPQQDPTQDGDRLFLDDGRPSDFLQGITSILSALVSGAGEAYAFTSRLAELDLLEPVQVDIDFVDGSDTKLQGLFWIAAAALKALPAAVLAEMRDRGYLEWMYFQMASVAQISSLVARKNRLISGAPGPALRS
jgi:SapC